MAWRPPVFSKAAGKAANATVSAAVPWPVRDELQDLHRKWRTVRTALHSPTSVRAPLRGRRGIAASASGPSYEGMTLLRSQLMARQAREFVVKGSARRWPLTHGYPRNSWKATVQRLHMRLTVGVCGFAITVSTSSLLQRWLHPPFEVSSNRSPVAELARTSSLPSVSTLTTKLLRKNTKETIREAYSFLETDPLGVGSFGVVHRATHKRTGLERAVKRIDKQDVADSASLVREVEALRVMDHPNVCRLIEYFEDSRYLWLVMELCRGEELCDHMLSRPTGIAEAQASKLIAQMLRATLHCHAQSVLHRDLKPENFLYKDASDSHKSDKHAGTLKLVDFGFSRPMPATPSVSSASLSSAENLLPSLASLGELFCAPERLQSAGTLVYRSPQSLAGAAPSRADDVWSLGIMFHILLTGRFPFSTNDDAQFQARFDRQELQADVEGHMAQLRETVSRSAADFAARLLAFDASKRASIEAALSHPFITSESSPDGPTNGAACLQAEALLEHCDRFQNSSRLQRIAAVTAARFLLDDTAGGSSDAARAAFQALDKSGRGYITSADLRSFARTSGADVPSASWFASLSRGWPALAEPRGISYTGLMAATLDNKLASGDRRVCRAAFDMLDCDGDGSLSSEDLSKSLGISPSLADRVMSEAMCQLESLGGSASPFSGLPFAAFHRLMQAGVSQETSTPLLASAPRSPPIPVPATACLLVT